MEQRELENRVEAIAKDLALTLEGYRSQMNPGLEANIKIAASDLDELLEDIRNS